MTEHTRTRLRLTLDGLIAVHAVRAASTALAAVPELLSADVSMAGVVIEIDRHADREAVIDRLRTSLDAAGLTILSVTVERDRILPLA